jgi:hypothetical protein
MRRPTDEEQAELDRIQLAIPELLCARTQDMSRHDHIEWAREALGLISNSVGVISKCATDLDDELTLDTGMAFLQKCVDQHLAIAEALRS